MAGLPLRCKKLLRMRSGPEAAPLRYQHPAWSSMVDAFQRAWSCQESSEGRVEDQDCRLSMLLTRSTH